MKTHCNKCTYRLTAIKGWHFCGNKEVNNMFGGYSTHGTQIMLRSDFGCIFGVKESK